MKTHSRLWMLLAGAMILITGHGTILYYASSHLALSSAVIAGVVVLVVVKHLGGLGGFWWRRRRDVAVECHLFPGADG